MLLLRRNDISSIGRDFWSFRTLTAGEGCLLIRSRSLTDTNIYFFDKHQQPKVPGEYTANDYKSEKRLWKKPKRYTPEQYYGMQGGGGSDGGTGSEDNYEE